MLLDFTSAGGILLGMEQTNASQKRHLRGGTVKKFRDDRDLSMDELAKWFGQDNRGSLAKFESGERSLSDDLLLEVYQKLQIPVERLATAEQMRRFKRIARAVGEGS